MRTVSGALDVSPPRMSTADLERRTATALVYAVVVLAALFAPSPTFVVLVAILAALGYLPVWLLLALVPTWVADSVAYLVGSRVGRRKIVPRISPGKTWEGTLAGFGAAAVAALLIAVSAGTGTGAALLVAILVGPVG